jgi:formate dehydrogenase major subunit
MKLSRRDFLKLSGATAGGLAVGAGLPAAVLAQEGVRPYVLHKKVGEVPTICTYCAVGCGQIVAVEGNRVVNIEGDPDHPINQGSLCSKGSAAFQVANNPRRLTKPLYRAPGSDKWEEKSWDWMLDQIARRIKNTRDAHWIEKAPSGKVVNRIEAIAFLGGSQNTNEECYLWVKALRAMGLVYIEHQARI